jgi:hypothetical protein
MITSYVGIEYIIEEINRQPIPNTYWNIEEIKEWTYQALSFIDTKMANIKAKTSIEILNGKGIIPSEIERIDKVFIEFDKNTIKELHEILPYEELNSNNYTINAGYIYVNFEKGNLSVEYYTVPTDITGKPLIPNNIYYIKAVISYIRYKLGDRAFWQNKILQNQLQMLEQEWLFYLPSAQTSQKINIIKDSKRFRKISNRHFL